jgi:hypothetical protein
MDSIAASAPQSVVDSLDFSLGATADYVTSRLMTSFAPSGGTAFNPRSGTKIMRFHLADELGWLDGGSLRISFDIVNLDAANPLQLVSAIPRCLFSRLMLKVGGNVAEDITSYNRVAGMFEDLINPHALIDLQQEGLGDSLVIPPSGSRRVSLKLMSGLLNQGKYLPLKMLSGLTLELQLADATDFCSSATNKSSTLELHNPECLCDLVQLDSALQSQYYSFLL